MRFVCHLLNLPVYIDIIAMDKADIFEETRPYVALLFINDILTMGQTICSFSFPNR